MKNEQDGDCKKSQTKTNSISMADAIYVYYRALEDPPRKASEIFPDEIIDWL